MIKKLPAKTTMYQALVDRDSTFEGIFFVGVKTTGIFCRPTCPARKPKFENVEYFPSAQEALFGGYRACMRCHPLEKTVKTPELLEKLKALVEENPTQKISDWELKQMGIDPSTARRQFQKHYGLTFQAYQRGRRLGMALHEVRNGESVIGAQLDAGFESASGFWEAFRKIFGAPPSEADTLNCLFAKWLDTPLGAMLAVANDEGLFMLEFVDRRGLENEIKWLRKKTKSPIVPGNNVILEKIEAELASYFEGENLSFSVPILMNGTSFENAVWNQLLKIPTGTTASYAELAKGIENKNAVRAVGRANGKNCLAIIIPCHRVIGADGNLTGYGGGLWRKKWLLEHEREFSKQ
ncbi:MAG: trifunctional transcriptional activator/DNA repair protein Ada/methylated-DNA--[protein]-cysteine S-methyltransferase [Bacteroidetes bacterium]|jgi:AraC family transcriptional regulator of adaptative response/methylated-DNA-[protein]-cysteine methyltransferase|nr:trifunctional transcriptional activator/DNA repair protein Ada/methylated-DNA--[protein]-cysteine S-methyltransferase [Bacteroidota bacterium]MDF1864447.1 trifunctional transcriptional activator/DNA repair protein Ada/methylated-DNA--[protein]-cysteine S-methyltransferase [Saprospiraceae bacterium]